MATSQALQRAARTLMPVTGLTPSADNDALADLVVRNARVFTDFRSEARWPYHVRQPIVIIRR
jgi:hypothetical protein